MPAQKYADKYSPKAINMEPVSIPPNNSHQHLMNDLDTVDNVPNLLNPAENEGGLGKVSTRNWITVGVLCFVNLINYMDRYTLAVDHDEAKNMVAQNKRRKREQTREIQESMSESDASMSERKTPSYFQQFKKSLSKKK